MEKYSDLPKIKGQLEELEKRINSLSKTKTSQIQQINTTIAQISQNLQNAQSLLASLQTNLENNSSNISTLQSNLSLLEQEVSINTTNIVSLQTSIENNSSNISTLQTSVENNSNNISTLQTSLETLQTLIDTTSFEVTQLENSLALVASTGDYNDLKNLPTNLAYTIDVSYLGTFLGANNIQYTQNHYFVCEPDMPIYFDIDILAEAPLENSEFDVPYELKINNTTEYSGNLHLIYNYYERSVNKISFVYYPTKHKNSLSLSYTYEEGNPFNFCGMVVKMTGHNAFMLTRDNRWQINCYKNKYYITAWYPYDNRKHDFKLYELTKDSHDIASTNYSGCVPNNAIFSLQLKFLTDGTIEETTSKMGLGHQPYSHRAVIYTSGYVNLAAEANDKGASMSTFRPLNTVNDNSNYYTIPGICILKDKLPIFSYKYGTIEYFYLNNVPLSAEWVDTVCVWQQDMTDETYYPFRGCMLLRDDGYYYYFPEVNSTYCVKLGFGKNGKLIKRKGSETLYAYIGGFNRVTQYVLEKDSNGIYSVTKTTTKYGLSEYCETQDDLAIIVKGGEIYFVEKMFD